MLARTIALPLALVLGLGCRSEPPPRAVMEAPAADMTRLEAAVGSLEGLPPKVRRAFEGAEGFFAPMGEPQPGEWLAEHPEPGQTFAQWKASDPNRTDGARRTIYVLPIGDFPPDASPSLDALARLTAAWFAFEVKTLPAVTVASLGARERINDFTKRRQLLTTDILANLVGRVPEDAYCLIGVTMVDLYPDPSWNFVFGQASLRGRVGVYSFARSDPAFFGDARPADWRLTQLRRSAWTMLHEIAHMFGLAHCVHYECLVSGSNSQQESDRRPPHACPVCLRKLHHAIGFDPAARYRALGAVYRELDLEPEAAWVARRLRYLSGTNKRDGAAATGPGRR